jgi:hypothetical protein
MLHALVDALDGGDEGNGFDDTGDSNMIVVN